MYQPSTYSAVFYILSKKQIWHQSNETWENREDQNWRGTTVVMLHFEISFLVQSQVHEFYIRIYLYSAGYNNGKKVVALEWKKDELVI